MNKFKREWLSEKFRAEVETRQITKRHTVIDSNLGEYLSFKKYWEAEGEDEDGLRASIVGITKCCKWAASGSGTMRTTSAISSST